jgi:hypothetical protein
MAILVGQQGKREASVRLFVFGAARGSSLYVEMLLGGRRGTELLLTLKLTLFALILFLALIKCG